MSCASDNNDPVLDDGYCTDCGSYSTGCTHGERMVPASEVAKIIAERDWLAAHGVTQAYSSTDFVLATTVYGEEITQWRLEQCRAALKERGGKSPVRSAEEHASDT